MRSVENPDDELIEPSPSQADEDAAVLAEIERLQNASPGWGRMIVILVLSFSLFLAADLRRGNWESTLILIVVLFIHELGHYVAMRVFGYRNVQMFFIPFFGAAVSGQHFNVAGWKKVLVSLMGPVPGIALGIALGGVGLATGTSSTLTAATMCLLLNGFQLLPVLPLDGGWVLHETLFCRHPLLDVAFRGLAALALLALGGMTGDWVLLIVALVMGMNLSTVWRQSRIIGRLRDSGIGRSQYVPARPPELLADMSEFETDPVPEAPPTIPVHVGRRILSEVRQEFPRFQDRTFLARITLQVFETLNSRPPEALATLGLLFVYAASFLAALVGLVVVGLAQMNRPPLPNPPAVAQAEPGGSGPRRPAEHQRPEASGRTIDLAQTRFEPVLALDPGLEFRPVQRTPEVAATVNGHVGGEPHNHVRRMASHRFEQDVVPEGRGLPRTEQNVSRRVAAAKLKVEHRPVGNDQQRLLRPQAGLQLPQQSLQGQGPVVVAR